MSCSSSLHLLQNLLACSTRSLRPGPYKHTPHNNILGLGKSEGLWLSPLCVVSNPSCDWEVMQNSGWVIFNNWFGYVHRGVLCGWVREVRHCVHIEVALYMPQGQIWMAFLSYSLVFAQFMCERDSVFAFRVPWLLNNLPEKRCVAKSVPPFSLLCSKKVLQFSLVALWRHDSYGFPKLLVSRCLFHFSHLWFMLGHKRVIWSQLYSYGSFFFCIYSSTAGEHLFSLMQLYTVQ